MKEAKAMDWYCLQIEGFSIVDVTQILMDILSRKVSKRIDAQIRERVEQDKCVCCGEGKIWRDGNCRSCDYQVQKALSGMPRTEQVKYLRSLYEDGLRLKAYQIKEYRKPLSILQLRARGA